ncbi:MAG: hypothetical protein V1758_16640 [Pseudomonadota bacterium]
MTRDEAVLMTPFPSAELQGRNPVETLLSLAKTTLGKAMAPGHELKLAASFFKELN